jgi:SAM-dependent methyltransferase
MFHDVLHERDRHLVLDEARAFIREAFSRPTERAPLLDADRRGHTREEYDRLRQPLPLLSPMRLAYAAQKLGMATLGRLSRGVELGWKTGFDSGQSLDYVYENRPRGRTLLGRAIDRAYLGSIGWKGIRQRKAHLEKLLAEAIGRVRRSGRAVRILDIAGGPGRYLLETIQSLAGDDISALIRDNVPANLEAGRKLAEKLGLSDRVRFELGDAFDEDSLASIDPAPNVSIVSGLYELFPENEPVLRSLKGVARAMREGGYLIYTGQPWHPQVEMIARVLTNRDGQPWIMRRRTQQEMDDLVRAAGFRKLDMEIDDYGIFTVSLAAISEVG